MEDASLKTHEQDHNHREENAESLHDGSILQNGQKTSEKSGPNQLESLLEEPKAQLINQFTSTSHEMVQSAPKIKGAIQAREPGEDISSFRDIGWHKSSIQMPDPLIGGISNRLLFSKIRRFNKDVFSIRAVPSLNITRLDLTEAKTDKYASDKLKLNLERFYLTIILGLASLAKHISRLRSWKETRRTFVFFMAYFLAWKFNLLTPLFLGTLSIVVSSNTLRNILFPPAPRALVSLTHGGLQKPQAGQLGTIDTLTGAPEKEVGEAVEEEAAGFVNNLQHLIIRSIRERHSLGYEDPLKGHLEEDHETQQTNLPMEEIIWSKASPQVLKPIIRRIPLLLGELIDNWERIANCISPTVPFSEKSFLRIDAALMPLFLVSLFVTNDQVYRIASFGLGFIFFGDPIITPALAWLEYQFPGWTQYLQPKNNLLCGVPTNIQSTLTLLRIGEANNTPLPPVPTAHEKDPNISLNLDSTNVPLRGTHRDKIEAFEAPAIDKSSIHDPRSPPKKNVYSKIANLFKRNTRAVVVAKLAIDKVRATTGSETAREHIGVLPKAESLIFSGPSQFKARHEGVNGWLYLTRTTFPALIFSTQDLQADKIVGQTIEINVERILELRRSAAFEKGMAEVVAGWSSGKERELLGGLEIAVCEDNEINDSAETTKLFKFTAIPERDELFNRLVAMGKQRWENV